MFMLGMEFVSRGERDTGKSGSKRVNGRDEDEYFFPFWVVM